MTGDSSGGAALRAIQPSGSHPQDLRRGLRCVPPSFPRPPMQAPQVLRRGEQRGGAEEGLRVPQWRCGDRHQRFGQAARCTIGLNPTVYDSDQRVHRDL